jgi:hypothetical protein
LWKYHHHQKNNASALLVRRGGGRGGGQAVSVPRPRNEKDTGSLSVRQEPYLSSFGGAVVATWLKLGAQHAKLKLASLLNQNALLAQ